MTTCDSWRDKKVTQRVLGGDIYFSRFTNNIFFFKCGIVHYTLFPESKINILHLKIIKTTISSGVVLRLTKENVSLKKGFLSFFGVFLFFFHGLCVWFKRGNHKCFYIYTDGNQHSAHRVHTWPTELRVHGSNMTKIWFTEQRIQHKKRSKFKMFLTFLNKQMR